MSTVRFDARGHAVFWLDVTNRGPQPKASAERTRSRRSRAGSRRNKRLRNVGRFLTDVVGKRGRAS